MKAKSLILFETMSEIDVHGAALGPNEILRCGLELMCSEKKILRVDGDPWTSKTNVQRFKDHCGASHCVAAHIWKDLHAVNQVPEGHSPNAKLSIHWCLEALRFLCRCKRESEREAAFDKSRKTLRKWCWCHLKRIQALKSEKIVVPDDFGKDEVWTMSVDGVHSAAFEPAHAVFSKDRKCFSHKKKRAGLCYELGVHVFESKLAWMNGPFPSGRNDNGNFAEGGPEQGSLKQKLASIGKKALGDKTCNGHPSECSTFNASDSRSVKQFKSRVQMRHEKFNGMMKEFSCLANCFRHRGEHKFGICFEATAVICQCRMENGEPLCDLLAGIRPEEDSDFESDSDDEESSSESSSDESSSETRSSSDEDDADADADADADTDTDADSSE